MYRCDFFLRTSSLIILCILCSYSGVILTSCYYLSSSCQFTYSSLCLRPSFSSSQDSQLSTADIDYLVHKRYLARRSKDYTTADEIKSRLEALSIDITDLPFSQGGHSTWLKHVITIFNHMLVSDNKIAFLL